MYGEIILIISLQEQTFPSLIQIFLLLLSRGLQVRHSPQLQQEQKHSILLKVLVSNMIFTEKEREKLIHTPIIQRWIHSQCFTMSLICSGETQLLVNACYLQGKIIEGFP